MDKLKDILGRSQVVEVTDSDIDKRIRLLVESELQGSTVEDAYRMLEDGSLDGTALAIELQMLNRLKRRPTPLRPPRMTSSLAPAE